MNALVPGGLFVAAVALTATLAYQTTAPIPVIAAGAAKAAPVAAAAVQALPQYTPPPPDEFAAINLRPLFSPTREPVAEDADTGTTSQPPPDVSLIGVAIGLRKSVALLKSPNDPVAISASIGQVINGWRLARIDADDVVFSANGSDYTVKMRAAAGTTPVTAATTPHQ